MSTLTGQLLFGFIFVIIGFVGGLLVMAAWHARSSDADIPAPAETDPGLEEVVQVFRSKSSSQLAFRLGGKTFTDRQSADPAFKQYLAILGGEISSWLGTDQAEKTIQRALPVQKTASDEWKPEAGRDLTPLQKIALPFTSRKPEPVEVKPDPRTLTIVHQIDAILQEMLQDSDLKTKAIRLDENPAHEVIVWVGVTRYEGIDSVPDLEVKSLIKKAVDRWERQSAAEL